MEILTEHSRRRKWLQDGHMFDGCVCLATRNYCTYGLYVPNLTRDKTASPTIVINFENEEKNRREFSDWRGRILPTMRI